MPIFKAKYKKTSNSMKRLKEKSNKKQLENNFKKPDIEIFSEGHEFKLK